MPTTTTASTLQVPGATIYYETRGVGPLLLIIPGGPQDAGVFDDLAGHLADRYTVVAIDPRGNSRSPFTGEPEDLRLDVQADDAAAVIRADGLRPGLGLRDQRWRPDRARPCRAASRVGRRPRGARTADDDAAGRTRRPRWRWTG